MSTTTRVLLLGAALLAIATIGVTVRIANRNRERTATSVDDSASDPRDRPDAAQFWHPPPRPSQPRVADEPNDTNPRARAEDASTVAIAREVASGSSPPIAPSANTTELLPAPSANTTDAGAHPGLDLAGNTDLTPEEWRTLGERGELRFRLPARSDTSALVDDTRARALGLRSESIEPANDVLRRGDAQLLLDVRGYYREAAGRDPTPMPFDSMLDDIASRTPSDVVARVNGELARERGGVSPWQATTSEMTPYERMLRELIAYEVMIERQLAEIVGPANAHALVWGDNALGASAYTYRGTTQ
jgi:hypothetical protein